MLGSQIEAALKVYQRHGHFLGTFAKGARPFLKVGSYGIFNTMSRSDLSEDTQILAHWVVIGRPEPHLFEVFDATPRQTQELFYIFNDYTGSIIMNSVDLMPENSSLCGEFAVFFLVVRLSNMDLDFTTVLNLYLSKDVAKNKAKVLELLQHLHTENPSPF